MKNHFNDFLTSQREMKRAARSIAERIQIASHIAKVAASPGGRRVAYALKVDLLQRAMIAFPGFFRPISFEHKRVLGLVVLFKMPGETSCHVPISKLGSGRAVIDLNVLPYKKTILNRRSFRGAFRLAQQAASL
jgi:hypothetical protein